MLAALHRENLPEALPLTAEAGYDIPVFDVDAWLIEIGLMIEWYICPTVAFSRAISSVPNLSRCGARSWRSPPQHPRTWVIRDFHSPNNHLAG